MEVDLDTGQRRGEAGPTVFCSREKVRVLGVVLETLNAVHIHNLRNLLRPYLVPPIKLVY